MAYNRQQMGGEVNPLFKKFVQEGGTPSTYIPADKRREIYDYMGKTNYTKTMSKQAISNDLRLITLQITFPMYNALSYINFNPFRLYTTKSFKINCERGIRLSCQQF